VAFALCAQANKRTGDERAALYARAAESCEKARGIYARESFPSEWAFVQLTSASVNLARAQAAAPLERIALATRAGAELRAALEVNTRRDQPVYWAMTTRLLGRSLLTLAEAQLDPAERRRTLGEAATTLRAALEVLNEGETPDDHAEARADLARGDALLAAP
jgi:hypothetical protein